MPLISDSWLYAYPEWIERVVRGSWKEKDEMTEIQSQAAPHIGRYTRKPTTVRAIHYIGPSNLAAVEEFCSLPPDESQIPESFTDAERASFIKENTKHFATYNPAAGTLHIGGALSQPGDFIVERKISGRVSDFTPVNSAVFVELYVPAGPDHADDAKAKDTKDAGKDAKKK